MTQKPDQDTSVSGRCVFCGRHRLRMYHLPDSPSRHVFCDGCGAAGPWGDSSEEAVSLYAVRSTAIVREVLTALESYRERHLVPAYFVQALAQLRTVAREPNK